MVCRGDKQPSLPRLRSRDLLGVERILDGVAGPILQEDAVVSNPETFELAPCERRLAAFVMQERARPAREQDARIGVPPCQLGSNREPLR